MSAQIKSILLLFACLALILSACASAAAPDDGSSVRTQVAETVFSQLTLSAPTPTPQPTPTATPRPSATLQSHTSIPTAQMYPSNTPTILSTSWIGNICDAATFVSDDTIPDGSVLNPGVQFTKSWTLINNGYCNWTDEYSLVFSSGNQMSGPEKKPLTINPIAPGQKLQVSVALIAPTDEGNYIGYWALKNPDGGIFGLGPEKKLIYVSIKVNTSATATITPSPTKTFTAAPATLTNTPVPPTLTATETPTNTPVTPSGSS